MASIQIEKGKLTTVAGYPRNVWFAEDCPGREFPGNKNILPRNLPLAEYLALQYYNPPKEAIRMTGSLQGSIDTQTAIFGGGGKVYFREWVPTSARWEECRAWVLRHHWSAHYSGRGSLPAHTEYGNDAVAAAWLHIPTVQKWANEIFSSKFGKILLSQEVERRKGNLMQIMVPEGDMVHQLDPERLTITGIFPDVEEKKGVSIHYHAKWGKWSGSIHRPIPGGWLVEKEWKEFKEGINLPATVYKNGAQEIAFLNKSDDVENDKKHVELSLPDTPVPVDVTGSFAAFFESEEAIVKFCLRHNVFAQKPFLGLHGPDYNQPGAHLMALNEDWAKIAWSEGAMPLPPVVGEVPELKKFEWQPATYNSYWERSWATVSPGVEVYFFGKELTERVDLGVADARNSQGYGKGWVRIPSDRKVTVSFGLTVRDPGDPYRANNETTVYTDGRLALAKR